MSNLYRLTLALDPNHEDCDAHVESLVVGNIVNLNGYIYRIESVSSDFRLPNGLEVSLELDCIGEEDRFDSLLIDMGFEIDIVGTKPLSIIKEEDVKDMHFIKLHDL